MAVRAARSEFDLASRIMGPVLRDLSGDLLHSYPLIEARNTSELFGTAGIQAFGDYLYKMSDYASTAMLHHPEVSHTLFTLMAKVAGAHREVMKHYPRAKRNGLSLTQVFKKHEPAIGLFINHIHAVQTSPNVRDDRLLVVALEAQKTAFIPNYE